MRHLERDQRNVRIAVFRRDGGRDVFVGLKLDDQIDRLANEDVSVPLGDFRL